MKKVSFNRLWLQTTSAIASKGNKRSLKARINNKRLINPLKWDKIISITRECNLQILNLTLITNLDNPQIKSNFSTDNHRDHK